MISPDAIPVDAAGGILYRDSGEDLQILLIYRKGVWDLPKGKMEPGEDFAGCAARELAEETGMKGFLQGPFLTETFHEYELGGIVHRKRTRWFAFSLIPEARKCQPVPQKEEGIERVEWCAPEEALEKVGYENLVRVISAFLEKVDSDT